MSADAAGMGAMDAAMGGDMGAPPTMAVNEADAALGSAMDSAMDQGGAPAGTGAPAMDDTAGADIVDPGMADAPKDDDDGGLAG